MPPSQVRRRLPCRFKLNLVLPGFRRRVYVRRCPQTYCRLSTVVSDVDCGSTTRLDTIVRVSFGYGYGPRAVVSFQRSRTGCRFETVRHTAHSFRHFHDDIQHCKRLAKSNTERNNRVFAVSSLDSRRKVTTVNVLRETRSRVRQP